jgi:hypothetical protein
VPGDIPAICLYTQFTKMLREKVQMSDRIHKVLIFLAISLPIIKPRAMC